jgi:hypothetical protein
MKQDADADAFYAGFKPVAIQAPGKPLDVGDRVVIRGDHPHAGREGVIAGVTKFKYGIGGGGVGVEIRFDDGNGCFVFKPCKLERLNTTQSRERRGGRERSAGARE